MRNCQGGKQETYHGTYVRKVLSEAGKKKVLSEETKKKISEVLLKSKEFQEYMRSEEHRRRCSESKKGTIITEETRMV